jgi:hypothetical protein
VSVESDFFNNIFKEKIKKTCLLLLKERIEHAHTAMQQAQETANNQEKSSVGDKYETARAMSQIERDMNAQQFEKAQLEYAFLESINTNQIHKHVALGCLFELNDIIFFVATGLGSITVSQKSIMVISHKSPLFEQLKMKKVGDVVVFKNEQKKVTNIC